MFVCKKEERSSQEISRAGVESTSEDSDSTDEGIDVDGSCEIMLRMLNLKSD